MPPVISVIALIALASQSTSESEAVIKTNFLLVLLYFSLSLAQNTLVTGLIITKILTIYRDTDIPPSRASVRCYANRIRHDVIPILIESAAITFTAQLVQILTFSRFDAAAVSIINNFTVILFVRGFFYLSLNCTVLIWCFFFDYI